MLHHLKALPYVAAIIFAALPPANTADAAEGDAVNGKKLYQQCVGCHRLKENFVGPMHCGVIDRPAASIPDYAYSSAMRESGLVWDDETLHGFLTSPFTFVSGTKMGFFGLTDEQERSDIIAYMRMVAEDPEICGKNE